MSMNPRLLHLIRVVENEYGSLTNAPSDEPIMRQIQKLSGGNCFEEPKGYGSLKEQVKDLIESGMPYRDIGKQLGLSYPKIHSFINNAGLNDWEQVYDIYQGDTYIATGTFEELAGILKVSVNTVRFYVYSNRKKRQLNGFWGDKAGRRFNH